MMRFILILLVAVSLGGCAELQYYGHAFSGQLEVLSKRRPIPDVIDDAKTKPEIVQKLKAVERMHDFAISDLYLPDSDSFRSYSDLGRPYVLWNVFATPELSLATKQWCYPFFGCLGYRSYFAKAYAETIANELEQAGWDVHIAPSPAYSTRGFFSDPIYNPMLRYDDITLAGILFHELAHEKVYFINDSELNESFAVAVQNEGIKRWLAHEQQPQYYSEYIISQQRDKQFVTLLLSYRKKLENLYQSDKIDDEKRLQKKQILASLKEAYISLRKEWGGYRGYEHWFDRPLNNARLAPVGTYQGHVAAFSALLTKHRGDLSVFYAQAEKLSKLKPEERRAILLDIKNEYH